MNELGCTAAKIDLKCENEKFEGFHGDKIRQYIIPLLQRFAYIIASCEINVTLGSPQKNKFAELRSLWSWYEGMCTY